MGSSDERRSDNVEQEPTGMCPYCGTIVTIRNGLTTTHDWPPMTRQVCPGTRENHRNPESDGRPLWNGKPNPHYYRNRRPDDE